MSRPARLLSLLAVAAAFLLLPAGAAAHPLGNFSTNQLLELRFDRAGGELHYVLDQAEIPSFQQLQRYDSDGDGRLAGAETGPLVDELLATAAEGIAVTADGRPVDLGPARAVELSFPAGQAGLRLTRLEADFRLPATVDGAEVEVANDAYASRVGWRAIRAVPGAGTDGRLERPRRRSHRRPARLPRRPAREPARPVERPVRRSRPGTGP